MALNPDNVEEESFIILGTSPGSSLDVKCNGVVSDGPLDKAQIEDAMKDLSTEASMAFKAHFKLGDCPSPASLMVASTIISEDKSTEELQKRFGEILDENVLLKETLKQNNDSMKDQFLLIASCQEDMMKTHSLHKEKFDETRELVEKLRQDNKKLKQELTLLKESAVNTETGEPGAPRSGPASAVEFVTCPDDDTINKLTAQLELVEKQRRQVIVDNEKLTWQKESLEHIVDATSRERDDLKEKLKHVELQLSEKDNHWAAEMSMMKCTIQDLQAKLQSTSSLTSLSSQEIKSRDALVQQLESKLVALQAEHKASQLKVLELENVKMEFSKHKSGTSEIVKIYKDQIQELHNRLKDAQITLFQPVRLSISPEPQTSSEFSGYLSNVKLYDRALKHLAELLNGLVHGASDNLVQTIGLVASLQDYKLERTSADQVRSGLGDVKQQLEKQYSSVLNNIGQVRSTMTILEGIFKDYNELLKKALTNQNKPPNGANVEALTSALLARGQELSALQLELKALRQQKEEAGALRAQLDLYKKQQKEDVEVLRAQLDLYKSDFEAERAAREQMAAEKETLLADLRTAQRVSRELTARLQQGPSSPAGQQPPSPRAAPRCPPDHTATTTGNMASQGNEDFEDRPDSPSILSKRPNKRKLSRTSHHSEQVYKCPKCLRFSSEQYKAMEDHFDFCLDDF